MNIDILSVLWPFKMNSEDLKNLIKDFRTEMNSKLEEISGENKEILGGWNDFRNNFKEVQDDVAALKEGKLRTDQKLELLLREKNEKNVMVFNFPDTEDNNANLKSKLVELFKAAKVEVEEENIEKAYRVGKIKGKRAILVKFNRLCFKD